MTRIVVTIDMELLSDVIFSSGNSIPGGTDITLRTDSLGRPYVPGSTIKGLLREALGNYLCWTNTDPNADLQGELNALMGERGVRHIESERRLVCGDLRLAQRDLLDYAWGKSTDDAVCMKQLENMKVTEVAVQYTRCFFINQFDHTSGIAKHPAK